MSPVSILPVIFSIASELVLIYFLVKFFEKDKKEESVKFDSIDGLRGFLAFFVFLHHACIYYFCFPTYVWELPPSQLYSHFGSTSVCLFFMITSFLFITKLIENKNKQVDWLKFIVSRVLRLYPLYMIAFIISVFYAALLSEFKFVEPVLTVTKELTQWFLFSVFDGPDINSVKLTPAFMLSVLWSLKYEWVFYLFLPIIGFIFFKAKPTIITLILTIGIASLILIYTPIMAINLFAFTGGIFAAFLARSNKFCQLASGKIASVLIVICLTLTVTFFETAFEIMPLILISIAFVGIACGNSLFGILTHRLSRNFGRLSYGIYLLQGLILFAVFRLWMGFELLASFSPLQYWLLVIAIGLVLTLICYFLYHLIEAPSLRKTGKVTSFLRKFIPDFLQQKIA